MLIPVDAYSLGIGNIKLQSKLNETLKAEIELLDSTHEDVSNLYINLAPMEKFSEAGIPRSYFLKSLKIKPVKRENGSIYIELSSREVLKELVLSFVLEVNWKKGLLYRDFTLLVDPPAEYNPPVITAAIPETRQFTNNDFPFYAPVVSRKDSTEYGPIRPSDYIRKIAKRTRYDEISTDQMIIALFKANPDAFFTDNINALIVKKTLQIPEKEKILEVSRKEASEQVSLQDSIWKERLATRAATRKTELATAKNNSQTASDTAGAMAVAKISEKPLAGTPSNADMSAILAKLNKLEQQMQGIQNTIALKELPPVVPANATPANVNTAEKTEQTAIYTQNLALLAKVNQLEQEMDAMQKTLASKDQLIATLQQNKATPALPVESPTTTPIAPVKEVVQNSTAIKTVTAPEPTDETNPIMDEFIQWLKSNYILLLEIAASIGVFSSLFGCFLWIRKKQKEKAEAEALNEYLKPLDLAKSSFKNLSVSVNNFLSNDHLYEDQDEIDLYTEVDICLNYGYYTNAESLIRQAIEYHPESDDYKLKLFEIFVASRNKEGFELFKMQLKNSIKRNHYDFWNKVADMEKALNSESPLIERESNQKMIRQIEESLIEKADVNIVISKPQLDAIEIDDNEDTIDTAVLNEEILPIVEEEEIIESNDIPEIIEEPVIDFDMYEFDDSEIKSLAKATINSIDKIQEPKGNEIDFEDIEVNPIAKKSIQSKNKLEEIADDEFDFDLFAFDDSEEKSSSKTKDNAKTATSDEITFDLFDFDEPNEQVTAKTDIESDEDAQELDLSPEQILSFKDEFENPPEGLTKSDIAKKYGLSLASGQRLLRNLSYWSTQDTKYNLH